MGQDLIKKCSYRKFFEGRELIIATMHGKEKVLSPILTEHLGVRPILPNKLNTDLLGTFTGEVDRKEDPLTTLRKKCMMALELNGGDLVIGNEGSFGPHPSLFFVAADEEIVMLIDLKNEIEITAKEISTKTNFNNEEIRTEKSLREFAKRVGFPDHGLILKDKKNSPTEIFKGINDFENLLRLYKSIFKRNGKVFVETDMRAMHNPARMEVIKSCTQKLIHNISSVCENCGCPGFVVKDAVNGLPCENCAMPTSSVIKLIYECKKCSHSEERFFPNGKKCEDPMYCNFCNP